MLRVNLIFPLTWCLRESLKRQSTTVPLNMQKEKCNRWTNYVIIANKQQHAFLTSLLLVVVPFLFKWKKIERIRASCLSLLFIIRCSKIISNKQWSFSLINNYLIILLLGIMELCNWFHLTHQMCLSMILKVWFTAVITLGLATAGYCFAAKKLQKPL